MSIVPAFVVLLLLSQLLFLIIACLACGGIEQCFSSHRFVFENDPLIVCVCLCVCVCERERACINIDLTHFGTHGHRSFEKVILVFWRQPQPCGLR